MNNNNNIATISIIFVLKRVGRPNNLTLGRLQNGPVYDCELQGCDTPCSL